jgi:hypothetical protein
VSYLLTSQVVTKDGASHIEYRFTNKTPEAASFIFSQIKTPEHPSGWAGKVKGKSSVSVSVAIGQPDVLFIQKTQLLFWSDNDEEAYQAIPLHMYTSESGLEFKGQVKYLQADYSAARNVTVLEFQVKGDSAEGAVVYRDSSQGLELIQRIEYQIDANTPISVTDPSPPAGRVSYRVKVGRGVNGRYSENMAVSVPEQ